MPQSSSKRGRQDAGDTEDTGAPNRRAQPGVRAKGEQPPTDPPAVTPTTVPAPRSPQQLREDARIAFLVDLLLPAPAQQELNQVEALLAMLMGGEWAAAVLRLLVLPLPKPKATAI